MENLAKQDLVQLVNSVFPRFPEDRALAILVDLPKTIQEDNPPWQKRRELAWQWAKILQEAVESLRLEKVLLLAYPNVGSNNANLPEQAYTIEGKLPATAETLTTKTSRVFTDIFAQTQLFIALTEYSATAPLKMAAGKYVFRAATMPGFCETMIPALRLDYGKVNERVMAIKNRLDAADAAEVIFAVDQSKSYTMLFDLRFRTAHASSGRFPDKGTAGNLPSGEAYIVPYEGDLKEQSKTEGILPVQFGKDVVFYHIKGNRVAEVEGTGEITKQEADYVKKEPAYSNIAELGFGVLADFGVQPVGEVLLDEKLGLHVAFGRSEHLGGSVGPSMFTSAKSVIHIDRIYVPSTQPRVVVKSVTLHLKNGTPEKIMADGKYTIFSR